MDEFDERIFSSRVLGRKVKAYLDKSADLNERIQSVLEKNTSDPSTSDIAKIWAREKGWHLEYCLLLLTAFKTGISEGEK